MGGSGSGGGGRGEGHRSLRKAGGAGLTHQHDHDVHQHVLQVGGLGVVLRRTMGGGREPGAVGGVEKGAPKGGWHVPRTCSSEAVRPKKVLAPVNSTVPSTSPRTTVLPMRHASP